MENQLEYFNEIGKYRDKFLEALPDVMSARDAFRGEVYKDRALSGKVKRLIALGLALQGGSAGCIISQTKSAVEAGASRDEVLEAVAVALDVGGAAPTASVLWVVVKLLEEMGKW
jgi:AhpD family alkylhydroperoxidase